MIQRHIRKKILYVITKSNWGGAQRYVCDLASCLPRDKFDIAVVSDGRGLLTDKLARANIRVIQLPPLQRDVNLFKEIVSLWSLAKIFIRERPDIVHLSSSKAGGLGAVAAFAAKLLTFNFKLLAVFTVHGWGFKEDRLGWQRAIIFFFSWLSTLFQDKVILIDTADYRTAKRFIPKRKLALIRHGITPIDFLSRQEARLFLANRIVKKLELETQVAGTIAELTKNKGINYLVDAINQIKLGMQNAKCKFLVIGDGEDKEKIQKQINSLGVQDAIYLVGFVSDAARYLKGFDLFVLPSVKEGLPYALMEAMAAGLPVVASRVSGISDLIENQKSGLLVPPKDARALASAVAELLVQSGKRQAMAEAARHKIENEFGMNDMLAKTMALYSASNL